ncbi:MAG: TIGR03960 family B12-binding radical SAM protein [Deltaproteobacteria bacterium]|nr:TIGR03960 family B12-binding radical SAM protein [Deltaproteobacteria bacterium]
MAYNILKLIQNLEIETRTSKLDQLLALVQRPTRYLGSEINAVHKDPRAVSLRVALLFPDLYEIGMSHLGLGLLYQILNREPDIWAERAYAPAPDLEQQLRGRRLLLGSLESGTPLRQFDLVGVSLMYELGYTNLLTLLELGGIPWLAQERRGSDPVVIAGGPGCFNPEPVAPFFDAMVIGEGEEVILELAALVRAWKEARAGRAELWAALEELEGVYVPAFFDMDYDAQGYLRQIVPRGRRDRISKRLITDLNQLPLLTRPIVPYNQIVHDRLSVEIARGCTRGCRFCQAGMIYRPVRERTPEAVLEWIEQALAATGYEEVSLLSLSTGDYGCINPLLTTLMDRLEKRRVAVSLPSLRADTLTAELMSQINRVRKTGFTIAPEAGSQRLRQQLNKNLTDAEIIDTARQAFDLGWNLIKLYFMIGFPMETQEDLEGIAALSRQVLATGKNSNKSCHLHVSLNTMIPKPHTPLQWERQLSLAESRDRLNLTKNLVQGRSIAVKWNPATQSWLEGIMARGDRRLARVLMLAHGLGCRLDAWTEHFHLPRWQQAFQAAGVDPDFYLRERQMNELLPWDHIDSDLRREFLVTERQRAWQGQPTPDCRGDNCQDCGVCDLDRIRPRIFADVEEWPKPASVPRLVASQPVRYRLTYAKLHEARWFSHLELVNIFHRSLRRSGLPINFSQGFHPLPRVSFYSALPVGVESLEETLDLELTHNIPEATLLTRLNEVLPPNLNILTATRLLHKAPRPDRELSVYKVTSPEAMFTCQKLEHFLEQPQWLVTQHKPKKTRQIDVRPLVAGVRLQDDRHLELVLRHRDQGNLKASEIITAIFALPEETTRQLRIVKLKSS